MRDEEITSLDNERVLRPDVDEVYDPSKRAEAVLDYVIKTESKDGKFVEPEEEKMTVAEAITSRPVLDRASGRGSARVLFVTTNEQVLIAGSYMRRDLVELAKHLDEVHVICLIPRVGQPTFERAGNNIWFYRVHAKNWWQLPWAAKAAAKEALVWNKVVRPDLVVGVDLFEAGLAAQMIARSFKRPLQFHVYTDPFREDYKKEAIDNKWRVRIAKHLLNGAKSVKTMTGVVKESIQKRYRRIGDIEVLPRFHNFTGLLDAVPAFDLHQKYPNMAFIMLAFGPLTADSYLHDLFATLNRLLHNPSIGLVLVGDGPAYQLFLDKIKLLGIEKNVVIKREAEDLISYLKTADLLIEMDTAEESEVRILQSAAAGLPAVMYSTDFRLDLFKDGETSFICQPKDQLCIAQSTSKFINTVALRKQFKLNTESMARDRLHEDPQAHYRAIATSIESVLSSSR